MRYLVSYDVADDRRRNHVANLLKDFGPRIQESVFLMDLDDALANRMRERLSAAVDPSLDKVHIFPLCQRCAAAAEAYGVGSLPCDQDFYIM